MSIIDGIRPSQLAARVHRRYEIVVSGGLSGALHAAEVPPRAQALLSLSSGSCRLLSLPR